MSDSVSVVSSQGWFSRIVESIKGILVGCVLVLLSVGGLFWNEGRSVTTARTLQEVGDAVVSVAVDKVEAGNQGKLVHVTGTATTTETLKDDELSVSALAIALRRDVEMYQWVQDEKTEKRSKIGGGEESVTTYSDRKAWDDSAVDTSGFQEKAGHQNPGALPFDSKTFTAALVTLGAFKLPPALVGEIRPATPLPTPLPTPVNLGGRRVQTAEGGWYLGGNPSSPEVGDVRIHFRVAKPQEVSVIAAQLGDTFAPWTAPSTGETKQLLQLGTVTAQAMVQAEKDANTAMTWIIRAVGFAFMFMGFALIFKPLVVVADVLPLFGSIVGMGTGLAAFGLAAIGSLLTIGVAWIFYRPLIGVPLVVLGVGIFVALIVKGRAAK